MMFSPIQMLTTMGDKAGQQQGIFGITGKGAPKNRKQTERDQTDKGRKKGHPVRKKAPNSEKPDTQSLKPMPILKRGNTSMET